MCVCVCVFFFNPYSSLYILAGSAGHVRIYKDIENSLSKTTLIKHETIAKDESHSTADAAQAEFKATIKKLQAQIY